MYLKIGDKAPDFTLKNYDGKNISLNDLNNSSILLWFFPKANTPGWAVEGQGFRDEFKKFENKNVMIVGVSADSQEKQQNFVDKYDFQYLMLCDDNHAMLKAYKAWGPKKFMGREYDGIHRISYLVDNQGIIKHVYDKVKTKSHACDVLESLWWLNENL